MTLTNAIFPQTFRVRYGEANQYGKLMIHHLFNYLQEIAFNHGDFLANSVEGKAQWDMAVVWTRMKIILTSLPTWREDVHIYTWISPLKDNERFTFRNFSLGAPNNREIGYGYGSLIFFDLKTRKAIPIPKEVKNYPT
ncbi:MAG: acyl-ACP thioesterase domain-containing protein, partial [Promethearchaeota archaeon]